jgi:hypothetical protein
MKTKTVELNLNQVKVTFVDAKGNAVADNCRSNMFQVELVGCDIIPSMIVKVKFPELDNSVEDENAKDAKVKVTYLEPSQRDIKYIGRLKNWISPK